MASANAVMLKSPKGVVKAYDPDEYDIPGMLKGGFSRSPGVMVAAHMRQFPTPLATAPNGPATPADSFAPGNLSDLVGPGRTPTAETMTNPPVATPFGSVSPALPAGREFVPPSSSDAITPNMAPPVGQFDLRRFGTPGYTMPEPTPGQQNLSSPTPLSIRAMTPVDATGGLILGGPGGLALGAGLGRAASDVAAVGRGYAPASDLQDLPAHALGEAATQLAFLRGGNLLSSGVSKVLPPAVMMAAIRGSLEPAQTALKYGINAGKSGLAKINELTGPNGALGGMKADLLRRLSSAGVAIDPTRLAGQVFENLRGLDPEAYQAATNSQIAGEEAARQRNIAAFKEAAINRLSGTLNGGQPAAPQQLQAIDQLAQKLAEQRYPPSGKVPINDDVLASEAHGRGAFYQDETKAFSANNKSPITPQQLEAARKREAEIAKPYFNARSSGDSQAEQLAQTPRVRLAVARAQAYKDALESMASGATVPHPETGVPHSLTEVNGEISRLAKLQDVISNFASNKSVGTGAKMVQAASGPVGRGIGGAAIGAATPGNHLRNAAIGAGAGAMASPLVLSALAHGLASPAVAEATRYTPYGALQLAHLAGMVK